MGYFDWIFKYKFDNEKQTLIDLRTHTIDWYSQLTRPFLPLLKDIEFNRVELNNETAETYSRIAQEIFEIKIMPGAGLSLYNVLNSMTKNGIPIFTSRNNLISIAHEYQKRGMFIKELAGQLHNWENLNPSHQILIKQRIFEN